MVLEALFGSAAIGASGIWGYNRENFLYDREMRQEQEFQIIDMRLAQVNLWRDDVREMIGLTEKKMDVYMIVNALQLGFTVTLFTEGRLEPGTPEWLLWLYMLSLAGAFTLLLASVWFAMHASVAAQGNAARLLTQFVRPPIPSWEQLEATRTYGHAFEGIPARAMMRVPLLQTISEGPSSQEHHGPEYGHFETPCEEANGDSIDTPEEPAEASASGSQQAADPWGLERRGDGIYELQRRPLTGNRHTNLVREASKAWQAYDAFARASMTLGTIHLCSALSYYILGYVLIQDGSPWAAITTVIIFIGISAMILRLDLSLTWREHAMAKACLMGGPSMASLAAIDWATYSSVLQEYSLLLVPVAYLSHILFLHRFLRLCHVVKQPGGSLLPMSFRSVLYLDIFGWLLRLAPSSELWSPRSDDSTKEGYSPVEEANLDEDPVHNIEPTVFQFSELNETVGPASMVCPSAESGCIAVPCTAASMHGTGSNESGRAVAQLEQDARIRRSNLGDVPRMEVRFARSRESELSTVDELDEIDSQVSGHPVAPRSSITSTYSGRSRNDHRVSQRLSVSSKMAFPKHTLRLGSCPTPLRPEDIDTLTLGHDDIHGCKQAKAEAFADYHHKRNGIDEPLLGVGPAGVVPQANSASFAAASYAPEAAHLHGEAALTGHDSFLPGQLPWYVFRSAVLLIMALWCFGLLWSVAQALHIPDVPDKVLPEQIVVASDDAKGAEWYFAKVKEDAAKSLPAGRQIEIEWPNAHFRPTGISCDATGNVFAFSDDFQIFVGSMRQMGYKEFQIRSMKLARPCEALEGVAMDDIAIHCSTGSQACSAFVLHGHGSQIAECSLEAWPSESDGNPSQAEKEQSREWELQRMWLQDMGLGRERMVSLAIDPTCNRSKSSAEGVMTSRFVPKEGTCVVVGTNHGRIVLLKQRPGHDHQMMPTAALWNGLGMYREDEQATTLSNLQMVSGSRLLILHDRMRRVKVVHTDSAKVTGDYELPVLAGRIWTGLTGGTQHFYAISRSTRGGPDQLWQWDLPRDAV